jgi:transposase
MLEEARKHSIYHLLRTVPGLGKIRAAQVLPVVVTLYRFSSKRSFWAYCGLVLINGSPVSRKTGSFPWF